MNDMPVEWHLYAHRTVKKKIMLYLQKGPPPSCSPYLVFGVFWQEARCGPAAFSTAVLFPPVGGAVVSQPMGAYIVNAYMFEHLKMVKYLVLKARKQ